MYLLDLPCSMEYSSDALIPLSWSNASKGGLKLTIR